MRKRIIFISSIVISLFIIFFSIGFSAFTRNYTVDDMLVRVMSSYDVRIIDVLLDDNSTGTVSGLEYDYDSIISTVSMPTSSSIVSFDVTVRNFGNTKMQISDISLNSPLDDIFDIEVTDYTIGNMITDNNETCGAINGCILNVVRTFKVTLKYKTGEYDPDSYDFNNLKINFEFDALTGASYNLKPGTTFDNLWQEIISEFHEYPFRFTIHHIVFCSVSDLPNSNTYDLTTYLGNFDNEDVGGIKGYFNTSSHTVYIATATPSSTIVLNSDFRKFFRNMYDLVDITIAPDTYVDSSNVTNMYETFMSTRALATTATFIKDLDVSNVTTFDYAFKDCRALTIDISAWDTSSATSMYYMFSQTKATTLLLGDDFVLDSATDLRGMFQLSSFKTLDLRTFVLPTDHAITVSNMFDFAADLETIGVPANNNFTASNVTRGTMFNGCTKIVGGAGTTYVDGSGNYAIIDGTNSQAGYFTLSDVYTITLDANGGMFPNASSVKTFGLSTLSSYVLSDTLSKAGHIFIGWSTTRNGSIDYTTGSSIIGAGLSDDLTLYAVYGLPCTLTFNADGGVAGEATTLSTATGVTEYITSRYTPTRDGFKFIGWAETSGGPLYKNVNDPIVLTGNKTLYALWQVKAASYTLASGPDLKNVLGMSRWDGAKNPITDVVFTYWDNNPRLVGAYLTTDKLDVDGLGTIRKYVLNNTLFIAVEKQGDVIEFNQNCNGMFSSGIYPQVANFSIDGVEIDTSNVTTMVSMFQGSMFSASNSADFLRAFDTSHVTDMTLMFGWPQNDGVPDVVDLTSFTFNNCNITQMFYNWSDITTIYVSNSYSPSGVYGTKVFYNNPNLVGAQSCDGGTYGTGQATINGFFSLKPSS